MNASSYACALFESINRQRAEAALQPLQAWLSHGDAPAAAASFVHVQARLGELLYHHGAEAGVIPYNTGLLGFGAVDLLTVAPSLEEAAALEQQALARLS